MGIKIQLRRDTAQNWTIANPILKSGELGIETDTLKFKIGNGSARWNNLTSYAMKPGQANGVATLDSLGKIPTSQLPDTISINQEVQNAINSLSLTTSSVSEGSHLYFTTQRAIDAVAASISAAIVTSEAFTNAQIATEVTNRNSAIASANHALELDLKSYADNAKNSAITAANLNTSTAIDELTNTIPTIINDNVSGIVSSEINSAISTAINNEVSARNTAITNAVAAIPSVNLSSKTTNDLAEGSSNLYFTASRAKSAVASDIASAIATEVTNRNAAIASAAVDLSTKTTDNLAEGTNNKYFTPARALNATNSRFTQLEEYVQGIYDQIGIDIATSVNNAAADYVLLADRNLPFGYAGLDSNGKILDSALPDNTALLSGASFTGTVNAIDLNISGNLNVTGTTTTVDSQNLAVTDSLIYLAKNQYSADVLDIGIYGAYGSSGNNGGNHPHSGLVRDSADKKWKLISGAGEPSSSKINFNGVTYDTLKIGSLEADSLNVGSVSNTEFSYLDGVTSSIQTQINSKASIASPTFTGVVTIPAGALIDGYLKSSDASTSYLSKTEASDTYLSKSSALATYLSQSDALNLYLTKTSANSTYLSQSSASATYLTVDNAASQYATLSITNNLSTSITTAQNRADSAYTLADTANNKASGYLNSNSNITTNKISYGTSATPPAGTAAGDIYIQY